MARRKKRKRRGKPRWWCPSCERGRRRWGQGKNRKPQGIRDEGNTRICACCKTVLWDRKPSAGGDFDNPTYEEMTRE